MELKFRAWDGYRMSEVDMLVFNDCDYSYQEKINGNIKVNLEYQPSVKVMQYTGLSDENGKDIYVGDILRYNEVKYEVCNEYGFAIVRLDRMPLDYEDFPKSIFPSGSNVPKFCGSLHDYCVTLCELGDNQQDFEGSLDCEVIGNIYEKSF